MTRKHSPTSKAAENFIQPFKPNHKQKILAGLENVRVGATFEELALATGMRDSQVWKRLSEMQKDGTIFNTGITRKLKSGLQGAVWQKVGMGIVNPKNPKTEQEVKDLHNAGIPIKPKDEIQAWWDDYQDGKLEPKSFTQQKLF